MVNVQLAALFTNTNTGRIWCQSFMMPRPRPETNENSATKARRHKGFIYNKTFCVTLCPGVLVANFMAVHHDGVRRHPETNENVGPRSL